MLITAATIIFFLNTLAEKLQPYYTFCTDYWALSHYTIIGDFLLDFRYVHNLKI